MMMNQRPYWKQVAFIRDESARDYNILPPFDPPEIYCEIPFVNKTNKKNRIYPMVRSLLQNLGLDKRNIGTKQWNPFKDVAKPGNFVLIKPNLITHKHYLGNDALYSTVIHGSIIRPIIDYLYLAMNGHGTIVVADNPIVATDFNLLMKFTGIQAMLDDLKNRGYGDLRTIDLRPKILKETQNGDFYYEHQQGDPLGYVDIDLGSDSLFSEFDSKPNTRYYTLADPSVDHVNPKFRGKSETDGYHNPRNHIYTLSKSVLKSDLFINIAKMKTHCKAGVTLLLKNVVGVVYGKECIPHWRQGLPPDGDAFPKYPPYFYIYLQKLYAKLRKRIRIHQYRCFQELRDALKRRNIIVGQYKHLEHGNWKGNDTIWRTILDLNRILIYADKEGNMCDEPQRHFFGLIDGIIAQKGEGPMNGNPFVSSIIFGGFNPVVIDALAVKAMGISPHLIGSISKAHLINKWNINPIGGFDISMPEIDVPTFNFKLPKGWL